MPQKINLDKVKASLVTRCETCGYEIPPAEVRLVNTSEVRCPRKDKSSSWLHWLWAAQFRCSLIVLLRKCTKPCHGPSRGPHDNYPEPLPSSTG